jgi:hypothetical protein
LEPTATIEVVDYRVLGLGITERPDEEVLAHFNLQDDDLAHKIGHQIGPSSD